MLSYRVEYTSPLMSGPKEVSVGSSEAVQATASPVPSNVGGPSGKDSDKRQSTAGTGGAGDAKGTKLGVSFETKGPGK